MHSRVALVAVQEHVSRSDMGGCHPLAADETHTGRCV